MCVCVIQTCFRAFLCCGITLIGRAPFHFLLFNLSGISCHSLTCLFWAHKSVWLKTEDLETNNFVETKSQDPGHTVPAQKSNISKKIIGGRSLTFSFLKIIRRLLLFARLSYYFTPYNRLTDYSLQVHKLKKSSTLLSFWPAGFIPPPNDWKLTDKFFPIPIFWARCALSTQMKIEWHLYWWFIL